MTACLAACVMGTRISPEGPSEAGACDNACTTSVSRAQAPPAPALLGAPPGMGDSVRSSPKSGGVGNSRKSLAWLPATRVPPVPGCSGLRKDASPTPGWPGTAGCRTRRTKAVGGAKALHSCGSMAAPSAVSKVASTSTLAPRGTLPSASTSAALDNASSASHVLSRDGRNKIEGACAMAEATRPESSAGNGSPALLLSDSRAWRESGNTWTSSSACSTAAATRRGGESAEAATARETPLPGASGFSTRRGGAGSDLTERLSTPRRSNTRAGATALGDSDRDRATSSAWAEPNAYMVPMMAVSSLSYSSDATESASESAPPTPATRGAASRLNFFRSSAFCTAGTGKICRTRARAASTTSPRSGCRWSGSGLPGAAATRALVGTTLRRAPTKSPAVTLIAFTLMSNLASVVYTCG